jgi:hypothetical protein
MRILSLIKDDRINATSALIEMNIGEYLDLAKGAEDNLEIQRKVIKGFKPYDRLRVDLEKGCLIPPLVLALREGATRSPESLQDSSFLESLQSIDRNSVYIVDGLQRTNALRQVATQLQNSPEDLSVFMARQLRVEVWPDITISALTYRMILLNAGQKPMSLQHQLEVVSSALCASLLERFGDKIQIYRENDPSRRSTSGQYQFSLLAQAFQAFVQKKPHIDIRNEVIAELSQMEALETYGGSLTSASSAEDSPTALFVQYIDFLLDLDSELCRIYPESRTISDSNPVQLPSGITLLSRDTFHLGLSAAYAWTLDSKPDSLDTAKKQLFDILSKAQSGDDPLALETYEQILRGFKRKDNVGEATRNLIFNGLREYFRSDGLTSFQRCWTSG